MPSRPSPSPTATRRPPAPPGTAAAHRPPSLDAVYVLVERIGAGGTGEVWRALNKTSGEQVAIKLLRDELAAQPKVVRRFEQERAVLTALRHQHIVTVREMLTLGRSLGMVLDLVRGGSLRDRLRERGTLPPAEAAAIAAQIAAALAYAHRAGIVHRDLKPDNVLIAAAPGAPAADGAAGPHVRLTDFGLAYVLGSPALTTTGALIGTPNYLAPEIINGDRPTPATDLYSLGVLLYELVAGRPPFAADTAAAILRRHVEQAPVRPPGMPAPLWRVIRDCTRKDPRRRPTAATVCAALRPQASALAGRPALPALQAPPPSPRPRSLLLDAVRHVRGNRRLAVAAIAAAVAATAAVTGAQVFLFDHNGRPPGGHSPAVAGQPAASAPATEAPPGAASAVPTPAPSGAAAPSRSARSRPEGGRFGIDGDPQPSVGVDVQVFGPLQCTEYSWDVGHPALARPCFAVGPSIRVSGRLQALPGVRADVSLSIRDADTDAVAAGPFVCRGLMFTDYETEHDCGPVELTAPKGRRYVLEESWTYTGRSLLPGGAVRTRAFTW